MTNQVTIKEVAARDGLQAQSVEISLDQRRELILSLVAAGVPELEIGSFVSPKAVPQMAGTDALAQTLPEAMTKYSALVPNMKGYELARREGIDQLAIVVSATEQMNQNNIRKSLEDTFSMASEIMRRAREEQVDIHAYLAVAFECPYEGRVNASVVMDQAQQLMRDAPGRLVIADTIGAANPRAVKSMMTELVAQFGVEALGCHFHDTRAMGLANVFAALDAGVRQFDSSAGGLGGCPFAPGAKGNVATEDVVMLCESAGLSTGINIEALLESVAHLTQMIGSEQGGRAHYWLTHNWQKMTA
ncbi:hydroxymethylglutaryl-CoA lyase [Luminiphilus sp.]|jgi:hydroxymethylglutaryl-CoA lyase|nr:hydroxymethylglutaryl-CoA lyase [Luminiphilus sp.]MDA8947368.1 hydroxymethylglutaryl-CoA lyase [Luminiphilus sp.]MDB2312145.1 hydroxymethylglutaryl-CoA lyase [Luminiphilus sp.]MDB2379991.1 hydroxymethylglutaryl-CoA lyase [Luminiphilus sp.]MDB2433097.1 hydroxymethylglutaryl-CoA lyase [Luminiphilus sp.]